MRKTLLVLAMIAAGTAGAAGNGQKMKQAEMEAYIAKHGALPAATSGAVTKPVEQRSVGLKAEPNMIQYDDGTLTAVPATSSFMFGNTFDTKTGLPVQNSGSLTSASFFIASGAGTDNVFFSVFQSPAGTTAQVVSSVSVPLTAGSNAINAFVPASPILYAGAPFLAGVWYIAGDTVGLASGTTASQGHHGMLINDIVGTGLSQLGTLNTMVRASGKIPLPVELIEFELEG